MKKNKIAILSLAVLVCVGIFSTTLSAQNKQEYSMNKTLCAHYVKLSREMVESDNLPLAKVYAAKAIQANSWEKAAWANYDDVAQRLADNGELEDFETFIENSQAQEAPSAGDGGSKFEGC